MVHTGDSNIKNTYGIDSTTTESGPSKNPVEVEWPI